MQHVTGRKTQYAV